MQVPVGIPRCFAGHACLFNADCLPPAVQPRSLHRSASQFAWTMLYLMGRHMEVETSAPPSHTFSARVPAPTAHNGPVKPRASSLPSVRGPDLPVRESKAKHAFAFQPRFSNCRGYCYRQQDGRYGVSLHANVRVPSVCSVHDWHASLD